VSESRSPSFYLRTIGWEDGHVVILDQTRLPGEQRDVRLRTIEDAWEAIRNLRVRGAPLIGVTAAFGLYLGMVEALEHRIADVSGELDRCVDYLSTARPTAVNLTWALRRARTEIAPFVNSSRETVLDELLAFARRLLDDDIATNRAMGLHGLSLLEGKSSVLTHCNAGWLATAGYGTATAPLYLMQERGYALPHVFVDETRPVLQGARLTAWELSRAGFDITLICDGMAASVMARGNVQAVIVGCDRMTASGDFANKIGTLGVAIIAAEFDIPFYVVAPLSSIDFSLTKGDEIPIEERNADEVRRVGDSIIAPDVPVFNPAFDVTPARLISAIVTERGVVTPPFAEGLERLC
jgi:methylthioribose-1-phosphate isomerase